MHLDDRAVEGHRLDLDADDLLLLQVLEKTGQNSRLAPAVHAGVDGVPAPKSPR